MKDVKCEVLWNQEKFQPLEKELKAKTKIYF